MAYQMMFAQITPALITGAFANRVKFKAYLLFLVAWLLLVYFPIAHMVWGGGILRKHGVLLSRRIYEAIRAGIIYQTRLHYDRSGDLQFVHSETGVRTLRDEFDKVASHNEHHLAQIKMALKDQ